MSISTANSAVFLKGNSAVAHQVDSYKPPNPIVQRIRAYRDWDVKGANPQAIYENAITMARSNLLEDQFGDVATRSVEVNGLLLNALYSGPDAGGKYTERLPINTVFPAGNPLASQLRSVAMLIAARQALGVKRQIFFVSVGGSFDTHSDQFDASASTLRPGDAEPVILFGKHADLLGQLDAALEAFYDATVELGVAEQRNDLHRVRFGRTLTANGKGSDHGWGSHHSSWAARSRAARSTARSTTCSSAPAIRPMPVRAD